MRIIVVSNRLPLSIKKNGKSFEYEQTSGGLVAGLKAVKQKIDFLWIGNISDPDLDEEEKRQIKKDCWEKFNSIPVFVPAKLNDDSYNGFCNSILWPLLHSFADNVVWNREKYYAYLKYNKLFCNAIQEVVKEGDIVWIHDYHFMLLPGMVRSICTNKLRIGFFLHTPFPPVGVFETLPVGKKIIEGIISSDFVSFHIPEYLANFLSSSKKYFKRDELSNLRIKYTPSAINLGSRVVKIGFTPIGIAPQIFTCALTNPVTLSRIAELKQKFGGKKIILGVDRTDYIKGIPHRIAAFKRYLKNYKGNAVFLQIGVPSRMKVVEYRALVERIKTMVCEINSENGKIEENFVYFLHGSVTFEDLCALYAVSDVCLITSLADGMNLVALEYIACQEENYGRVVLSKFAGAASTLPGSITINPWEVNSVATAINHALTMDKQEAQERYFINKTAVQKFTAFKWAEENIKMLSEVVK